MGFRTVVVGSHCKLEYSLNFLIFKTAEETKRILLDEINSLIVESTAVAITTSLLAELVKHKINVIFCDEKHNPISELLPLTNSYNGYKKITEQINWDKKACDAVWREIIKQKIINQANTLLKVNKADIAEQLLSYAQDVEDGDHTNREGHAAKVYFNNMFHESFTRNDESIVNAYLDYGYTILLSLINRTIVNFGYLTQLGIHHIGETNPYNLSSDIIESFRFVVDEEAINIGNTKEQFKERMIQILHKEVFIDGKYQSLNNAVGIHFLSVVDAIKNSNPTKIKFIRLVADETR